MFFNNPALTELNEDEKVLGSNIPGNLLYSVASLHDFVLVVVLADNAGYLPSYCISVTYNSSSYVERLG